MSINHKDQVRRAKADFVTKLTKWTKETMDNPNRAPRYREIEAGLMQRILDVHAAREKTTQKVYASDVNRFFIPHIREEVFMRLCQINTRDWYLETLFARLWSKSEYTNAKVQTMEMVDDWFNFPRFRAPVFPYSELSPGVRPRKVEPPKAAEPERPANDSWDDAWNDGDCKTSVKQTPVEEFAAMAKEFGVPFQRGDNLGAAYKKLALLLHPDKHQVEETGVWSARMQRLNALRELLE
jgi:hypothetical protein